MDVYNSSNQLSKDESAVREPPIVNLSVWSSESAYIIGFTYADGYFIRTDKNKLNIPKYRMGWHLAYKDKDLLDDFNTLLQLKKEIKIRKDGSIDLSTIDQQVCLSAMERGITLNKTHRLSIPDMPIDYFPAFVRGYFDGDGTVYLRKQSNHEWISVNIVACNKYFLQSLGNRIKSQINLIPNIRSYGNYHRLDYNNMESIAFYRWIYSDQSTLYLLRKKKVFENWLQHKGNTNYGIVTCPICKQQYTKLADRSPICKKCKPYAKKYYCAKNRTYNWKKIQSDLTSNGKLT